MNCDIRLYNYLILTIEGCLIAIISAIEQFFNTFLKSKSKLKGKVILILHFIK